VLNAAAALMVAGLADELGGGVDMAVASIDGGSAARALDTLVRVSSAERVAEREDA
jgi:anthranilate phosphoribosyltransferase